MSPPSGQPLLVRPILPEPPWLSFCRDLSGKDIAADLPVMLGQLDKLIELNLEGNRQVCRTCTWEARIL